MDDPHHNPESVRTSYLTAIRFSVSGGGSTHPCLGTMCWPRPGYDVGNPYTPLPGRRVARVGRNELGPLQRAFSDNAAKNIRAPPARKTTVQQPIKRHILVSRTTTITQKGTTNERKRHS